jgi:trigger factor
MDSELRVSTSSPSQWGRILSIEVPRARFDAARAQVIRDLRRQVARPGFRKGHVPTAIVERDFAGRIESTTLEKLIPEIADQAIEREALQPISTPRVQNLVLDDPQVVRFDLELEVRPTIEVGPIEGVRVQRWKAAVQAQDVERTLESLREQHAQFEAVEREAREGDFVLVSYVPLAEDGSERTAQRVENYPFQVGAGTVVAEFDAAVRGLRPGDTARAEVPYAADHENPELAGKIVAFILTLQAVKEKHLPALDDDLAREVGVEGGLEALRSQVHADLERRRSDESERELREAIVDRLLEANRFEAPVSMVDQYLEALLEDYDERLRRMRMQPDETRRQEFAASARPAAERTVKRSLLLDALTRQHELGVTEEDVDKWIEDKVQAGGSGAAEMRAFFADAKRRRRLRSELGEEKVFEFLKSKVEIDEVSRPEAPSQAG